jgi:hypothetical protein
MAAGGDDGVPLALEAADFAYPLHFPAVLPVGFNAAQEAEEQEREAYQDYQGDHGSISAFQGCGHLVECTPIVVNIKQ